MEGLHIDNPDISKLEQDVCYATMNYLKPTSVIPSMTRHDWILDMTMPYSRIVLCPS